MQSHAVESVIVEEIEQTTKGHWLVLIAADRIYNRNLLNDIDDYMKNKHPDMKELIMKVGNKTVLRCIYES